MIKPILNLYTCSCGWYLVTKDEDEGVTPFMIRCKQCDGNARSSFYRPPYWVTENLVGGWWRKEMPRHYTKRDREVSQPHADMGGLFLHLKKEREPQPEKPAGRRWQDVVRGK